MKKSKIASTASKGGKKIISELNPIQALKEVLTSYVEWKRICETEETKRTQIEADMNVDLEEIRAKERVFLEYIGQSFNERKEVFRELFILADKAIEENNVEALALALNGVNEAVKNSPLKDLVDLNSVMSKLNSNDFEFKL